MLKTIHVLRIIVGFIAAWQVLGLLPVLTWLTNLESTTGNMWAIAFVKFVILLICSAIFIWLGRIKKKYDNTDSSNTELRTIGLALAAVILVGIAAAIIIPTISKDSALQSTRADEAQGLTVDSASSIADPQQPPLSVDPRDALLQMHVDQLNDNQYNAAVSRWLEFHPEASSAESQSAMSQLLQEVYAQYPRSALGPALDMALKRGQRNASTPSEQQPHATRQTPLRKFQCNGTYTQRDSQPQQEFAMSGVFVQITDDHINISGAAAFNGSHAIINRLENGYGFRNLQDETIEGFFNRFSGELSLIDRLGPKNADGSFKVSANALLNCQAANTLF